MTNFLNYLWPVLIGIYIISPFDLHPLFLDDLIASGFLFYMVYKNAKRKKQQQYYNYYQQSQSSHKSSSVESEGPLTLEKAYSLLGVTPGASLDDITKAYKDKMKKSHPDKVSHLSKELQEKARELTLELNEAYALIKKHR
ncbi:MAG: DnaJ domain-containing protein [Nitrospirota bacterium]